MPTMWDTRGNPHVVDPINVNEFERRYGWSTSPPVAGGGGGGGGGGGTGGEVAREEVTRAVPEARTPGSWEIYRIGSVYHLVWNVPVDLDGDGEYDEYTPVAYSGTAAELISNGVVTSIDALNDLVKDDLTIQEFKDMGGLIVGGIKELNNASNNPLEFFVDTVVTEANVLPWLVEPEIMALMGAAWLEGRELTEGELAGTDWWDDHSDDERDAMKLWASDPVGFDNLLRDNRDMTLRMLESAGVNNASEGLIQLLADNLTNGRWTETHHAEQIQLLADPYKRGELDEEVTDWLDAQDNYQLDTTMAYIDTVRDTVDTWLGPIHAWDDDKLNRWAGRLRNDPDAQQQLENMLSRQRLALFPEYEDPTLTYEDIAGPWRQFVMQQWGQTPDETDGFFSQIIRGNDVVENSKMLRKEGLRRGIPKVSIDAVEAMTEAFGGSVARTR